MTSAVLFVGHGSREPSANAEFERLVTAYRVAHPERHVEVAYIELSEPLLGPALASLAARFQRVVVLPLFLFAAGHVKNDLPLAADEARRANPRTDIQVAPCLGVHPTLVSLAFERAASMLPESAEERAKTALVVVGRGASDPDANGDFCKVTRLVAEKRGLLAVEPAFLGITEPTVDEALERAARHRPERVVVLPYLLFAGRLIEKLRARVDAFRARHTWIPTQIAPHLGVDPSLVQLCEERVLGAETGTTRLPCDTCQYRTALPGFVREVGGLRALLYSVRHTVTHAQAAMPVHLHRPLKKHVFVCGNADCVDRGSVGVLDAIRRGVKRAARSRDIRVTRTSCMGRCGEGPTVAVYPDGVFYQRVRPEDALDIVSEHLVADRLVGRLVGDVLQ